MMGSIATRVLDSGCVSSELPKKTGEGWHVVSLLIANNTVDVESEMALYMREMDIINGSPGERETTGDDARARAEHRG